MNRESEQHPGFPLVGGPGCFFVPAALAAGDAKRDVRQLKQPVRGLTHLRISYLHTKHKNSNFEAKIALDATSTKC